MGLLELIIAICLVSIVSLICFILIKIDRKINKWVNYKTIQRQPLNEIDGAKLIQKLNKKKSNN